MHKKVPQSILSLIEVFQQPFVLVDKNFTIVAANQHYAEQFGCHADDIIGCKCHQISHHSERPCAEHGEDCPHMRMFNSGQIEEALHIHTRHDGSQDCVEITAHPIRDDSGELCYMGESLRAIDNDESMHENDLVGSSPLFLEAIREASLLAASDLPVLISGESGVGKACFARYIHVRSTRSESPFITLDCCGLNEDLFESELFGHEDSGSPGHKQGLFELAHNGTLFLDEIGEVSPALQAKLLRLIETGAYRRVGGEQTLRADVRIISATNRDLPTMVAQAAFRKDLYYRLAGHSLQVPTLRERHGDIAELVSYFLKQRKHNGLPTKEALRVFERYPYPGNIRELKYIIELASLRAGAGSIRAEHLPKNMRESQRPKLPALQQAAADTRDPLHNSAPLSGRRMGDRHIMGMDADIVLDVLGKVKGSRRKAAQELGISERKIYRLIKRYQEVGLKVPRPYL